jgi:nitrate reductase assembly molybdenum cofactor insertion protein NarJ
MSYAHYHQLADLFDFPGPKFAARGKAALDSLEEKYPDAAVEVQKFLEGIPPSTLDRQELHTRTFDVQSLTTLDIGYVLFGDDYKRGALLSHLNREHAQAGNDCRGELADHLPNLLRLISKLKDHDLREELVRNILVPALILMIREFDPERIDKKNETYQKYYKTVIAPARAGDATVYRLALKAVLDVVARDFQASDLISRLSGWSTGPQTADFLGMVRREMDIERTANPVDSGCELERGENCK